MQPKKVRKPVDVKLLEAVTMYGQEAKPGAVITITELSAQALVKEGKAEYVQEEGQTSPQGNETGDQDPKDPNEEGGQEGATEGPDEVDLLKTALDNQYKRDELAEAAKEAGVDFAYNAKKGEIIQAAIDQEKAEALLK